MKISIISVANDSTDPRMAASFDHQPSLQYLSLAKDSFEEGLTLVEDASTLNDWYPTIRFATSVIATRARKYRGQDDSAEAFLDRCPSAGGTFSRNPPYKQALLEDCFWMLSWIMIPAALIDGSSTTQPIFIGWRPNREPDTIVESFKVDMVAVPDNLKFVNRLVQYLPAKLLSSDAVLVPSSADRMISIEKLISTILETQNQLVEEFQALRLDLVGQ